MLESQKQTEQHNYTDLYLSSTYLCTYPQNIFPVDISSFVNEVLHYVRTAISGSHVYRNPLMERRKYSLCNYNKI